MSQVAGRADVGSDGVGPLERSIGYLLKQASTALRTAMDAVLRPLDLTVPQYSCLEQLGARPDLSSSDLARGVFVTRQAMHGVLLGLEERGLLIRTATAPRGRARPTTLTPAGQALLTRASRAVRAVERRMTADLDPAGAAAAAELLRSFVDALERPDDPARIRPAIRSTSRVQADATGSGPEPGTRG